MLKKGDKVIYLPSGREVEVQDDQNSGQKVSVIDRTQDPSPILAVNPSDLRPVRDREGF